MLTGLCVQRLLDAGAPDLRVIKKKKTSSGFAVEITPTGGRVALDVPVSRLEDS